MSVSALKAFALPLALLVSFPFSTLHAQVSVTPEEARAIAKEAYIYGFPMVDSYRITYAYFVAKESPEYKGPFNQIRNFARLMTPEDKAVQTPNSDTAYSFLGLDLRTEPVIITVPEITDNRYVSLQFVDAYTHNFAYAGSTTTGNDGGSILVAGPNWKGEVPAGVKNVIHSETELALVPFRTQVFGPDDIENVKAVQAGYKAQTLSSFLGQPAPAAAPAIEFIKPLTPEEQKTSLEFINILNFVMQFCPTHPSEQELMARFARIGIGAGKTFDAAALPPEIRTAIEQGIADAWEALAGVEKEMEVGKVTAGDLFGTREQLKNNYLYRMLGAVWGIYGNSQTEAIYPTYTVDADGQKLDGSSSSYTLRFAPDQMPPVKAFWSLTMYEMPASYLYPNPLNRYLLNSPMLPQFKRDADGGLTFYVQAESPGADKEANWLPAPKGPFKIVMRLYGPKAEAFDGTWKIPSLERAQLDKQLVTDAYVYLLGRAIAIRQEHTDMKEEGITYNVIKYNPAGSADFVNPNLDVAYLEAWIAVDDQTPVVLDVPEVKGRYYAAQILNEWGEVITNINERNYPSHPHGKFAFVAPGSTAPVPEDAVRIELHSRKAKLLGRVELKTDPAGAMALQKQFTLTPLGKPSIESAVPMASFGNKELIGVELFDNVEAVLVSARDVSPIAEQMQAKVRDVAKQAMDPKTRPMLDEFIKKEVVPQFLNYAVTKSGVFKNNWLASLGTGNYGDDYWKRTSANLVGLWANSNDEVVYFVATRDADGQPLNGSNDYVLEFSAENRPDAVVNAYWSVILVDVPDYRVVKNPLNRFNFNSDSGLKTEADGSLKILFASKPNAAVPESNWLPAPEGKAFSLTMRTYVPKDVVKRGEWFPPAIKRIER